MKKRLEGFIIGIVFIIIISGTSFASEFKQRIDVVFNSINLEVNGQKVMADNILYNGTTYVPIRKVAELLGKTVVWDSASKTASIKDIAVYTGPKQETIRYDNGDLYIGQTKDGMLHGYGKYTWAEGDYYEGEWFKGNRTGNGTYIWPNGDKYVGDFSNNYFTGKGTYYYENGATYYGDWLNDNRHGYGTMTFPNGGKHEGEYKYDQANGKGKYTDSVGGYFDGTFVNDEFFNGKAKLFVDGVAHIVDIVNGELVTPTYTPTYNSALDTPDVIESRIDGEFVGWDGDTIFKLQNGQVWQQTSFAYRYTYKYSPKVTIYRSGSVYKMQVDGVNDTINVIRIK